MSIDSIYLDNLLYNLNKTKSSNSTGSSSVNFSDLLESSEIESPIDLDGIFEKASEEYGVPVNLLKAVAKAESNFNANAVSSCGAQGIMQLMPATAKGLGVTDSFDPEQNIMGGAKYLSGQLKRFDGNVEMAVAAYNAGPNAVAKYGGVPPYEETQNYVKKVLGYCGEDLSAGTVISDAGSSDSLFSGAESLLQNVGFFSLLGNENLNSDDRGKLLEIYQYQLQTRILNSMDTDE